MVLMSPIKEISNIASAQPLPNSIEDEDQENLEPNEVDGETKPTTPTPVEVTGGYKRPEVIAQQCLYPRSGFIFGHMKALR